MGIGVLIVSIIMRRYLGKKIVGVYVMDDLKKHLEEYMLVGLSLKLFLEIENIKKLDLIMLKIYLKTGKTIM